LRQAKKEVKDLEEIMGVIGRCDVCRVAFATGGAPYIVPLNFGCVREAGRLTFYFHGAGEGRKHELMAQSPEVGFELDTAHVLVAGDAPCEFNMTYESVIGTGTLRRVADAEERLRGLDCLMRHYSDGTEFATEFAYNEGSLSRTTVLALDVASFTCKRGD